MSVRREPPTSRRATPILRLLGLALLAACGVSGGEAAAPATTAEGTTTTEVPATTTTVEGTTTAVERPEPVDLELRPVLLAIPGACAPSGIVSRPGQAGPTTTPSFVPTSTTPTTTTPVLGPDDAIVPSIDDDACYVVGPVGFTGDDLVSAEAGRDVAGQWQVTVAVADGARPAANALFNACYQGAPTCPSDLASGEGGRVAIVLDGAVVSAPAVQSEDLADEAFQISGDFTEADAEDLAAALAG